MPKVKAEFTKRLSQKQTQVLRFIMTFQAKHHQSPSLEEIAKELGISIPTVYQHLQALIKKGYISKSKNEARSISVNPNISEVNKLKPVVLNIPVLGAANAGAALLNAEEYMEGYLRVPASNLKDRANIFAIRIEGDSMNKARVNGKNIENRDFVLVNINDVDINNDDYVLCIIDGAGTVKKFFRDKKTGEIQLLPESTNPEHKPIFISSKDNFMVNGKIIDVVKK